MKKISSLKKGFTLIELLVVIAIIAILAVLVFVALNPAVRFRDARNSRRTADVNNILTAVHECIVDNAGSITPCTDALVTDTIYEMKTNNDPVAGSACASGCTGIGSSVGLSTEMAAYLKSIPTDPGGVTAPCSEYLITRDSNNIISIASCSTEVVPTKQASR